MACRRVRFTAIVSWLSFVTVACCTEAIAAQGPDAPASRPAVTQQSRDVEEVKGTKLSSVLPPIERLAWHPAPCRRRPHAQALGGRDDPSSELHRCQGRTDGLQTTNRRGD